MMKAGEINAGPGNQSYITGPFSLLIGVRYERTLNRSLKICRGRRAGNR